MYQFKDSDEQTKVLMLVSLFLCKIDFLYYKMALSKEIPTSKKVQIDLLEFGPSFGDLSPLESFLGPKTPGNRAALRNFLYWVAQGKPLRESANEVVFAVLLKHPSEANNLKDSRYLANDVIKIYKEARFGFHLWLSCWYLERLR